jgi:hypothetical protein
MALVIEQDTDLTALDVRNRTIREWADAALPNGWLVCVLGATTHQIGWRGLVADSQGGMAARRDPSNPFRNDLWGTFAVLYSINGLRKLLQVRKTTPGSPGMTMHWGISDVVIFGSLNHSSWVAAPPLLVVNTAEPTSVG